jgi:hypothetical protein
MRVDLVLSYIPSDLPADQCWPWRGEVAVRYEGAPPRARYGGRWAVRIYYAMVVGPIPAKHEVDHTCSNTLCMNPAHLEAVTRAENMRRESDKVTHCSNGHAYTPENTYIRPAAAGGRKDCRMCIRERVARYRASKRAEAAA